MQCFFSYTIKYTQLGFYSVATPNSSYAFVTITNSKGPLMLSSNVDLYSKYVVQSQLKFLTPVLPKDTYTLKVEVLAEHWWWKEKSGKLSGSLGNVVSVEKILVKE